MRKYILSKRYLRADLDTRMLIWRWESFLLLRKTKTHPILSFLFGHPNLDVNIYFLYFPVEISMCGIKAAPIPQAFHPKKRRVQTPTNARNVFIRKLLYYSSIGTYARISSISSFIFRIRSATPSYLTGSIPERASVKCAQVCAGKRLTEGRDDLLTVYFALLTSTHNFNAQTSTHIRAGRGVEPPFSP